MFHFIELMIIRGRVKNYPHSGYIKTSVGRTFLLVLFLRGSCLSSHCCAGMNLLSQLSCHCIAKSNGCPACDLHERSSVINFFVIWGASGADIYGTLCAQYGETVIANKNVWVDREVQGRSHKCQLWQRSWMLVHFWNYPHRACSWTDSIR